MPLDRPPVIGAEDANNSDRLRAEWYLMNNHHEAFEDVLDNSEKYEDFENYLKSNDERGADILYKIAVVRGILNKCFEKRQSNLREMISFLGKASPMLMKKFDRRDEDFNIHAVAHCTEELRRACENKTRKERAAEKAEALVSAYQETLNAMKKCLQIKSFPLYLEHKARFEPPTFALPEIPEHRESTGNIRLTTDNLIRTQSFRSQHSTREPYYNSTNYRPPPASHNNSEYASQSSDCTSDTLSFTTDSDHFTSEESRKKREKKIRKTMIIRNSQRGKCNLPKFENPKEPEPAKAIDPNLVATDQKRFHQILCDKLRQYIKKQESNYQNMDDDILDEHIRNKMTTPGAQTPTHRPIVQLPTTHHRPHGVHMGPLPSTNPLVKDLSQDITGKVTGWLQESDRHEEKRRASKTKSKNKHSQSFTSYATNSGYENAHGGRHGGRRNLNQSMSHENPQSHLSVDSGLSSIRKPDDDFEMRGIKDRLIQETEGEVATRGLYYFNGEKYVVKVPGRPPTFDAFRKKYHDSSRLHSVRFFFKCVDADGSCAWMEVQNLDEPLPVVNDLVEAKVHEQRS